MPALTTKYNPLANAPHRKMKQVNSPITSGEPQHVDGPVKNSQTQKTDDPIHDDEVQKPDLLIADETKQYNPLTKAPHRKMKQVGGPIMNVQSQKTDGFVIDQKAQDTTALIADDKQFNSLITDSLSQDPSASITVGNAQTTSAPVTCDKAHTIRAPVMTRGSQDIDGPTMGAPFMNDKPQKLETENTSVKQDLKRTRPDNTVATMGSGEQITKLFAKANARAISREDRNVIAGQLKATKADLALAHKQIEEKGSASAALAEKLATVTEQLRRAECTISLVGQERDAIAIERDAAVKDYEEVNEFRHSAIQQRNVATKQRDDAFQKLSAILPRVTALKMKSNEITKERDAAVQERDAVVQEFDTFKQDRDSAPNDLELEYELKAAQYEVAYQAEQIKILVLDEHKIASLERRLEESRLLAIDDCVDKIHMGLEIANLELQLSRSNASELWFQDQAAYAQQQCDNALYAVQNMASAAAGQAAYLEQLTAAKKESQESAAKKLADAQQELVGLRAKNQVLAADLEKAGGVEVAGAVADKACEVQRYNALPKSEQKFRNQPIAGDCPCHFHVKLALKYSRAYEACHRAELDDLNFKQMCVEDELSTLKREVVRPVAEVGCQTEGDGEWEEEESEEESEEEGEEEEEDDLVFILSRSPSSPNSSSDKKK